MQPRVIQLAIGIAFTLASTGGAAVTVRHGDSLWTIARRYSVSVEQIKKLNHLTTDQLKIGQTLRLGGAEPQTSSQRGSSSAVSSRLSTVTVRSGDTLDRLARRYHLSVDRLKAINGLRSDALKVGQVLRLTAAVSSAQNRQVSTQVRTAQPVSSVSVSSVSVRSVTVRSGDSLDRIARRYGLSVAALRQYNGLVSDRINVGQVLRLAPTKAVRPITVAARTIAPATTQRVTTITVKRGDTLSSLARRYGTSVQTLRSVNRLSSDRLSVGQVLRLSSSVVVVAAKAPATTTNRESVDPRVNAALAVRPRLGSVLWPLQGVLTSSFGRTGFVRVRGTTAHTGIDLAAKIGTPIYAATAGEVTFAGWNAQGYGNLVRIRDASGREFYYGHCSSLLVSKGQKIAQGQKIALVGSTGRSTGPHLHFEVRVKNVPVNPLGFLPQNRLQLARLVQQ